MNKVNFYCLSLLVIVLSSCEKQKPVAFIAADTEQYKPDYHFTPSSGWMNDPNGLVYSDGEYHLFYQYFPDSTVWGPMHWGHAVSKGLINWEDLPIALAPDSLGYIFSGSAVYDAENSSGFGTEENPPLVAIFTYHDMEGERSGETEYQSQALAYSLDKGRTWEKYSGNPVLPNPGIRDFRDPKVSQFVGADGKKVWLMTLAVADHINFYSSPDLKVWTLLSEFGQGIGAHGGVWECPDLIPMNTLTGELKWVLLVSINPGGPQNGSATQYFIGDFEDGVFTPDDTMIRWLDYGPDNYAGVTWSNLPDEQNRILFIGWMSNWLYGQSVPTKSWRSAMTLPRELSLFDVDGTLLVKSAPSKEMVNLRGKETIVAENQSGLPSQSFELIAEVSEEDAFTMNFSNGSGDTLFISKEDGLVNIDRRKAGKADFSQEFAALHSAPMSWQAKNIRLYSDASSVEVFINEGELVMTSLLFPASPWKNVQVTSGLSNVKIFNLVK